MFLNFLVVGQSHTHSSGKSSRNKSELLYVYNHEQKENEEVAWEFNQT